MTLISFIFAIVGATAVGIGTNPLVGYGSFLLVASLQVALAEVLDKRDER